MAQFLQTSTSPAPHPCPASPNRPPRYQTNPNFRTYSTSLATFGLLNLWTSISLDSSASITLFSHPQLPPHGVLESPEWDVLGVIWAIESPPLTVLVSELLPDDSVGSNGSEMESYQRHWLLHPSPPTSHSRSTPIASNTTATTTTALCCPCCSCGSLPCLLRLIDRSG